MPVWLAMDTEKVFAVAFDRLCALKSYPVFEEGMDMPVLDELKENFDHFDGDGNGRIDRAEFKRLMDALGADAPEDELDLGFNIIDADNDGKIDFDEFSIWWLNS